MESCINLPPQIASAPSVQRPIADSAEQVMEEGCRSCAVSPRSTDCAVTDEQARALSA